MSQRVQQKKTARERMRYERECEQQAQARRRRIVIGVSITVVLALGGGIAVAVSAADDSGSSGPVVVPAHASGSGDTVIVYGRADASNTLDVWEDFRCPVCDAVEKADGPTIQKFADNGTYKIRYHMATFLDARLGGGGSKKALAAAGAALDESPTKFKQFHDVLFANQPDEQSDDFNDTGHLLDLAGKVPGLKTSAFVKAVKKGTYSAWAGKVSDAFTHSGVTGTPTLRFNGKPLSVLDSTGPITPSQYTALIKQAVAAAKK